jgi:hypothetical protein
MFIRKTRARQDAERSLRDAGAPRGEISLPLTFGQLTFTPRTCSPTKRVSQEEASRVVNPSQKAMFAVLLHVHSQNPRPAGCRTQPAGRRRYPGRNFRAQKGNFC